MSTTLLEMKRSSRRPARGRRAAHGPRPSVVGAAGVGEGGLGHVPVLATELLDVLDPQPGQTAIDCTFGDGGHARLVAERLGAAGTLIAIDRDPVAEERFQALAQEVACSLRFIRGGYAEALELLADEGLQADVAYFDLGMSSMQVDTRERGFSYSYEAPLDMRMDPDAERSARELVAELDERSLARLLRDYGEERHAGAIARAIVRSRERAPIETTLQLVDTINSALPAPARFAGGHPAKRSFQALRIAVNDELGQLDRALPLAWELLREGGALAAIAFHSLEDRRVKRFLVDRARGCVCPPELPVCVCGREPQAALIARRAIGPSADEVAREPACGLGAAARRAQAERGADHMTPPPAAAAPVAPPRRAGTPRRSGVRAHRAPLTAPRAPRRVSGPARGRGAGAALSTRPGSGAALGSLAALGRTLGERVAASASLRSLHGRLAGRLGIALVAFALIGIVTLQLGLLKLNGGIGRALEHEALLQRENAALSIENSEMAAGDRVELGAARIGMQFTPPGALRPVTAHPGSDALRAAAALRAPQPATSGESQLGGEGASQTATSSSVEAAGAETPTSSTASESAPGADTEQQASSAQSSTGAQAPPSAGAPASSAAPGSSSDQGTSEAAASAPAESDSAGGTATPAGPAG